MLTHVWKNPGRLYKAISHGRSIGPRDGSVPGAHWPGRVLWEEGRAKKKIYTAKQEKNEQESRATLECVLEMAAGEYLQTGT